MAGTEALIVVELVALGGLYLAGLTRLGRAAPHERRRARALAFAAGLLALGVALVPLDRLATASLSAHMVQHLVLLFVAPPLLILGAPHRVALAALPALRAPFVRALRSPPVRVVAHPVSALALLLATLVAWHLPGAYDAAAGGAALHAAEHATYLLAGLLLWLPLLAAPPRPYRLSPLSGVLYLLVAMAPGALVGLRLMTAGEPLYAHYAERGLTVAGQQAAGMTMWAGGSLLLAGAAVALGWLAAEREERRARPARRGSRVAGTTTLMLLCAAASIALAIGGSERSTARQPTPAGASPGGLDAEAGRGRALFEQGCATCHGFDARGIEGRGPSLYGAGAAAADFYLRTGRMPLDEPDQQPVRSPSPYDEAEIEALTAYVATLGDGPPVPAVAPQRGDVAEGQTLFGELCAGCHQIVGRGGIVTGGVVPDLGEADAVDVAEAIEVGPYVMPRFPRLSESEVDSIARYVEYTDDPEDRGGWGIGNLGPIPEGMVAWLLAGAALLLAIRLIGERTAR